MIYILSFSFSIVLANYIKIKEKHVAVNNYTETWQLIVCVLPIFIVAAIRYNVGVDYSYAYVKEYNNIITNPGASAYKERGIIFYYFMKLLAFFSRDYIIFFVITSFIICYFTIKSIYKYSENVSLSILFWLISGSYFHTLSQVRQFIVVAIIIASTDYIFFKPKRYIILCLVLCFIHSSAILGIVVFFLFHINKNLNKRKVLVLISVGLILLPFIRFIINNVFLILYHNGFISYGAFYGNAFNFSILNFVFSVLTLFMWLITDNEDEKTNIYRLYYNVIFAYVFFAMYSSLMPSPERTLRFFSYYLMLIIPYMLSKIKNSKSYIICTLLNIVFFGAATIYMNYYKGYDGVFPYHTIWSR